jgi:cellulose synthase/poly-beta-1,6-N-acetylglucosamine synthase-like glycosyltransferase
LKVVADSLLVFIALYPIVSAAIWIAGGVLFSALRERGHQPELAPGEGPPVSILIPAYNEELDIGDAVRAALHIDYHDFEVLVLDDGSTDRTAARAREAGQGDPRLRVLRDERNRGKAGRLNSGTLEARGKYLLMQDSDADPSPRGPGARGTAGGVTPAGGGGGRRARHEPRLAAGGAADARVLGGHRPDPPDSGAHGQRRRRRRDHRHVPARGVRRSAATTSAWPRRTSS